MSSNKPTKSPESPPPSPPPKSPPFRATASRNSSFASSSRRAGHAPHHPSGLRRSVVQRESTSPEDNIQHGDSRGKRPSNVDSGDEAGAGEEAETSSFWNALPSVQSRLLGHDNWDAASGCGSENCSHGTFSPRPLSPTQGSLRTYGSFSSQISQTGFGGAYADEEGSSYNESADAAHALLGDAVADGLLGGGKGNKMSTTDHLAHRHSVKSRRSMYLYYYIPFLGWIRQYKWSYLMNDFIAALTMASFYIPMSLSYASNLGHIPPVNGLYSFVFNPVIYAILGTSPLMVVGPEAAGSLLTGQVVRENINKGASDDDDQTKNAQIAGVVTFMAGGIIFAAGIFRLGFLDNVLSRPFLRGFISAIGIVIFIDQLIPEMGLSGLASHTKGVQHGSCVDKALFLFRNVHNAHAITAAVSFGSFAIIMSCREIKKHLQPRFPTIAYFPDRFVVVVLSAVFTWALGWDKRGLGILGDIKEKGAPFPVHFPFRITHLKYASDAFSTSFVIALLGFFESSVAAKSLGTAENKQGVLKNMNLSANRELVALGVANVVGGLFMALPAFGGYGRSKVNASTGGRTPMSSILLSVITVFCVLFMLPWFYYIPKGVLSAMISVVAYSLLEEIPPDLLFFIRIRGYSELMLMCLIFLATIFWNLKIGIAVGIGLSLLRVLRHSTRPRIQILGRVPGTTDKFENAERYSGHRLEFVDGVLIVKMPEPLTFANTGDLKARLRRLEEHGTGRAHPALPPVRRKENNKNLVFDVHGVTSLDGAGAQILMEIVRSYRERDVRVFFCRVPSEKSEVWRLFVKSGIVDLCGGSDHFVHSVEEALTLTELETVEEEMGREYDAAQAP